MTLLSGRNLFGLCDRASSGASKYGAVPSRERMNERLLDGFGFAISRYELLTKPSLGVWGAGASSRQQRPKATGGGTQHGKPKPLNS